MSSQELDVKPGDKVFYRVRMGSVRMLTVKNVTPTGIIKVVEFDHMSFRPNGMSRHARGFDSIRIRKMTPEVLFEIQNNSGKEKIRKLLGTTTDEKFSVESLEEAYKILEEGKLS